jgi:hypothetical protein
VLTGELEENNMRSWRAFSNTTEEDGQVDN